MMDVDLCPKFDVWTTPFRVGDAELAALGSFAWVAEPCCESFWAAKGEKDRAGAFPGLFIPGCSCLEVEAVAMLVGPRRGFRLGSSGARGAAPETGPCWLGCSACEEMPNTLPSVLSDERCGLRCGMAGGIPAGKSVVSSLLLDCSVRMESLKSCNGILLMFR